MGLFGKIIGGIKKAVTAPFKVAKKVIDFTVIKPLKFVGGLVGKVMGNPISGSLFGMAAGGLIGTLICPGLGTIIGAGLGGDIGGMIGSYVEYKHQKELIEDYMKQQQALMMQDQTVLQQMMVQYGGYGYNYGYATVV